MINPSTKAMRQTEEWIATARIDTRKRKLWAYLAIAPDESVGDPAEHALTVFQKPADTPVRVARAKDGHALVAVWNGKPEDAVTEPQDWPPHGMVEGDPDQLRGELRRAIAYRLALVLLILAIAAFVWWSLARP